MALNFPNRSRSYDPRGHRVRFWGHDGAFEVSFFMEQRALFQLSPDTNTDEAGLLSVFDRYRDRIMAAAVKVYAGRRREAYTLLASDF